MAADPTPPDPNESLLAETAWLGRLATQLVPEHEREDLVQDVLVSAMTTRGPRRNLRSWLATAARNLAFRRKRTGSHRRERERLSRESHAEFKTRREELRDQIGSIVPLFGFYRDLLRWLFLSPDEAAPSFASVDVVVRD